MQTPMNHHISAGNHPNDPLVTTKNEFGGVNTWDEAPWKYKAAASQIPIVPKVVMNDGMRNFKVTRPLRNPTVVPITMPITAHNQTFTLESW